MYSSDQKKKVEDLISFKIYPDNEQMMCNFYLPFLSINFGHLDVFYLNTNGPYIRLFILCVICQLAQRMFSLSCEFFA